MQEPEVASFSLLSPSVNTAELFPMFTICNCISDAAESANGPRYCAKDKYTKCMYELRCLPLAQKEPRKIAPSSTDRGARTEEDTNTNDAFLLAQQERLEALVSASHRRDLPLSIALPVDAYVRQLPSSGERFVVSLSAFTGLSLGDVIRSGWRLIEEADFEDILSCVEEYGSVCMQLPPHCNLSFSSILRQLNVRTGAAETNHRSRWVIGDWLLAPHSGEQRQPEEVVSDLEWLLHSTFSKLNVLCEADGTVLREDVLESRINDTIERIRLGLATGVWCRSRALVVNSQIYNSSVCSSPLAAEEEPSPHVESTDAPTHLVDLVSKHQQSLRREQRIIHNSRKQKVVSASGSGLRSSSSGKSVEGLSVSVSSARRANDQDLEDSERPMYFPDFGNSVTASEALTKISPTPGRGWQSPEMQENKLCVLTRLAELIDTASQRDAENRRNEDVASKIHRDALYSMLLRSSFGLARRWKSSNGVRSPSSGSQPLLSSRYPAASTSAGEKATLKAVRGSAGNGGPAAVPSFIEATPPLAKCSSPRTRQVVPRFSSPTFPKDLPPSQKQAPHSASRIASVINNVSPNKPRQRGHQLSNTAVNTVTSHNTNGANKRVESSVTQSVRTFATATSARERPSFLRPVRPVATPRAAPACKPPAINLKKAASGRRTFVPTPAQTARSNKPTQMGDSRLNGFERISANAPGRVSNSRRTRSCGGTVRTRVS
ncbi:hypothetical protein, conserved [Trypanosoma brucei gambiense DAL972]|uniref:Uncharacterized protein n=2 Tax=Trypanosoma brucei TaxID=5691 RepID=C9ZR40_TRYB9|nr:hypothetical protein, conserved [Trypanosoma brucei gambiense DAL972]RHW72105.1 hypothetical protein DPX39_060041200 [Trypanosoma brucei equiperdum]CBH11870.1 hypothetical protein, conserved [Trypanosoma brucei gambiense DAL972]|eukprot:XP_011774155.1 hypothetical protein, conserved [Trypanosoma brucei gambiense DAL972]